MTVYNFMNRVVYEGSPAECERWVLSQAEEIGNGRKIFRTWKEDGYTYYDVGNVYHM